MSLIALVDDLVLAAQSDEYLALITITSERVGDIANEIQRGLGDVTGLGGKAGVVIVLKQLVGNGAAGASGAPLDLIVSFHVEENVLFNAGATGHQKACVDVADRLAKLFHCYVPHGLAQSLTLLAPGVTPVQPIEKDNVAYEARFKCQQSGYVFSRVSNPSFSVTGASFPKLVQIACTTPAVVIYYTVDGSFPGSRNPAALVYTVPFNLAAAATVRAAAYLAGSYGSSPQSLKVN